MQPGASDGIGVGSASANTPLSVQPSESSSDDYPEADEECASWLERTRMPFRVGKQVVIIDLTSARGQELNGKTGIVPSTVEGTNQDRYGIEVDGDCYALLRENLELASS